MISGGMFTVDARSVERALLESFNDVIALGNCGINASVKNKRSNAWEHLTVFETITPGTFCWSGDRRYLKNTARPRVDDFVSEEKILKYKDD